MYPKYKSESLDPQPNEFMHEYQRSLYTKDTYIYKAMYT